MSPRAGWILSGLAIAFLVFDGAVKFTSMPAVGDSFHQLGWPLELAPLIGALELAIVALYAFPRTAVIGAVLLTGLLGGAIATHLRVGNPLFSHTFFSLYLGAVAWGGLWLRDPRVRALIH